jgi:hypothetical protein
MKKILFLLILLCIEKGLHAQYVYTIKADSVKITNSCDTAELIIENHTQTVPGFLFNKGRGRTEFRKAVLLNDSTLVLGNDTLTIRGTTTANNGLSVTNRNVQLGQSIGAPGNPAALKDNREIPMNGDSLYFLDGYIKVIGAPQGNGRLLDVFCNGSTFPGNTRAARFAGRYECVEVMSTHPNGYAGINFLNPAGYRYGCVSARMSDKSLFLNADSTFISFAIAGGYKMILNNKGNLTIGNPAIDDANKLTVNGTGKFTDTLKLPNIVSKSDTANYRPMIVDDNGNIFKMNSWNVSATHKSASVTASTYTVPADIDVVFVNYTGGIATITLPSGSLDRELTIKNLNTTNSVALSGLDASESNTVATRGAITVKYTGSSWVGISKY